MLAALGLTAIFSKLKGYLIALVVLIVLGVAAYIYIKMTHDQMTNLKQQVQLIQVQANALKATNSDLQKQIIAVTKREDDAENSLQQVRQTAITQTQVIVKQNLHTSAKTDPTGLQTQVNAQTQKLFDDLSGETTP